MVIVYRDEIGLMMVNLGNTDIVFDGTFALFTDPENRDYKIRIENIISITSCR